MGAFLFRRAALERIGGFDPRIALGEDFEILVRFQAAGYRRGLVEDTVLLYRRGHGSTTERAGVDNDGLDALRSKATFLAAHLARRRRSQ